MAVDARSTDKKGSQVSGVKVVQALKDLQLGSSVQLSPLVESRPAKLLSDPGSRGGLALLEDNLASVVQNLQPLQLVGKFASVLVPDYIAVVKSW